MSLAQNIKERMTGYKFVAAATMYQKYAGSGIYVKYRKSGSDRIIVKDASKGHMHFICPDRELFISVRGHYSHCEPPNGFDRYIDTNLLKDNVASGLGLDYVMTNFEHDKVKYHRRSVKDRRIQVLSDSGGLQLVRGVTDYIDPAELAEYYNMNVDAGMALDIPVWFDGDKIGKRAALVQKSNNETMLELLKPGVELINIIQGSSLDDRKRHRDIVHDDRIKRCALGGFAFINYLTGVNLIYEMMNEYRYTQYHVLGIFSAPYIALLVKIANTGDKPPHITSDATSHMQEARGNGYFYRALESTIMLRSPIGIMGGSIENSGMTLACGCPICATLKYRDILGFLPNRFFNLLASHNAVKIVEYAAALEQACKVLSPKQYNRYVLSALRKTQDLKEVELALDYIDHVCQHSLKSAQRKYAEWLNNWKPGKVGKGSIFDEAVQEQRHTHTMAQIEKVLKLYEKRK